MLLGKFNIPKNLMTHAIQTPFFSVQAPVIAMTYALLSGCAPASALQLAGTAVGMILEATGASQKDNADPSKKITDLPIKIFAGEQLNLTANGKPLSLVMKIYVLRSTERFKAMTYPQITTPDSEQAALADALISVREITLLPGKSYDITLKVPGDAVAIGVAGMFRSPFSNRWKLAFESKKSSDSNIIVGAHACALNASKGALIPDITPESARALVGVQCNL